MSERLHEYQATNRKREIKEIMITFKITNLISGVTILLSLTVFLNLVAEKIPTTSDAVPLIGTIMRSVMINIGI